MTGKQSGDTITSDLIARLTVTDVHVLYMLWDTTTSQKQRVSAYGC